MYVVAQTSFSVGSPGAITMKEALVQLLKELEQFSTENDSRVKDRSEKMLNITPDTGPFLVLLIRALMARRVLEIGTSNGYSTLWLAHAVEPLGGTVSTVEISPFKVELARKNFARVEFQSMITIERMGPFRRKT